MERQNVDHVFELNVICILVVDGVESPQVVWLLLFGKFLCYFVVPVYKNQTSSSRVTKSLKLNLEMHKNHGTGPCCL